MYIFWILNALGGSYGDNFFPNKVQKIIIQFQL